jgi:hypothetical protein
MDICADQRCANDGVQGERAIAAAAKRSLLFSMSDFVSGGQSRQPRRGVHRHIRSKTAHSQPNGARTERRGTNSFFN